MTKEKWFEVIAELNRQCSIKQFQYNKNNKYFPEDWLSIRGHILKFIEEGDEATEVYNMENGKQ